MVCVPVTAKIDVGAVHGALVRACGSRGGVVAQEVRAFADRPQDFLDLQFSGPVVAGERALRVELVAAARLVALVGAWGVE